MEELYFVMINQPSSRPSIMMQDDGIAWYESIDQAVDAAESNGLASAYGYEVFCLGEGCA